MTVRETYDALQRGDMTVLPRVADIVGELADALEMLKGANVYEKQQVLEHIKCLDLEHTPPSVPTLNWGEPNDWF